MSGNGIDFVIAWVDGRDPDWQRRRNALSGDSGADTRAERYRDWGLLPYWFRGVERFAPWVRTVWLVCDQQPPAWLDLSADRLRVVRHEDYLPPAYRPCFNSNTIELNLHRIEGLSERFVLFNDDMFLLRPVAEDFFFRNGLPRDAALLNPVPTTDLKGRAPGARIFTLPLNNTEYLNREYEFRACVRRHPLKWLNPRYGRSLLRNLLLMAWPRFVGFDEPHLPQAYLKSVYQAAWTQYADIMDATSRRPFRDDRDVSEWLIRDRQLAEGGFSPRRPVKGGYFDVGTDFSALDRTIRGQRAPMVCINDAGVSEEAFDGLRAGVIAAFEAILPGRSAFERAVSA